MRIPLVIVAPPKIPHTLYALALMTTCACKDEAPALYVSLDPPREVSASGPGADLRLQVTGDVRYPIRVEVEPFSCPDNATCADNATAFPALAKWQVFEEAVACDFPSASRHVYKVSVFDDAGLTTQPAYFSFMCIE